MIIYLEETLNLMSNGRLKEVENLVKSGEVKTTEKGTKYLLIDPSKGDKKQELWQPKENIQGLEKKKSLMNAPKENVSGKDQILKKNQ